MKTKEKNMRKNYGFDGKKNRPVNVYPEIIDKQSRKWEIVNVPVDHGARVYIDKAVACLPVSSNKAAEGCRLHEMAHIKWSPPVVPKIEGVPEDILQVVEDSRMHALLNRVSKTPITTMSSAKYIQFHNQSLTEASRSK